jgi:hypothetical protein
VAELCCMYDQQQQQQQQRLITMQNIRGWMNAGWVLPVVGEHPGHHRVLGEVVEGAAAEEVQRQQVSEVGQVACDTHQRQTPRQTVSTAHNTHED